MNCSTQNSINLDSQNNVQCNRNIHLKAGKINSQQSNPAKNNLEKTPQTDVFEKEAEQKKGLSNSAKWIIGLGLATITVGFLTKRFEIKNNNKLKQEIEQLFSEKIKKTKFDKKITFKDAKTVEEGINFTKNVLGIKEVDPDFTIEAINNVNSDLVRNINRQNGELFMPTALRFKVLESKEHLALIRSKIDADDFMELWIDKNHYDRNVLTENINSFFNKKIEVFTTPKGNLISDAIFKNMLIDFDQDLLKLVQKYNITPEKLTIEELQKLNYTFSSVGDIYDLREISPKAFIDYINKHSRTNKIKPEILKWESKDDIIKYIDKFIYEEGVVLNIPTRKPSKVIFHEMGHLQDLGLNLKSSILKDNKIDGYAYIDLVNTKDKFKQLSYDVQQEYLAHLPLYREFIDSENIQRIAGNVSTYATTGRSEFIAEVYSGLISGKNFSEEIMNLYKKYNGPLI